MSPLSLKYLKSDCEIIEFNDNFSSVRHSSDLYTVIPFSDFAKEHNIKLPLIKSEDGVDLYEGDEFTLVIFYSGKWFRHGRFKHTTYVEPSDFLEIKKFKDDKAALDWIEEQKPKDIIISPSSGYPIIVRKNPICGDEYIHLDMSKRGDYNGANIHLTITELREAVKSYELLHEKS